MCVFKKWVPTIGSIRRFIGDVRPAVGTTIIIIGSRKGEFCREEKPELETFNKFNKSVIVCYWIILNIILMGKKDPTKA